MKKRELRLQIKDELKTERLLRLLRIIIWWYLAHRAELKGKGIREVVESFLDWINDELDDDVEVD